MSHHQSSDCPFLSTVWGLRNLLSVITAFSRTPHPNPTPTKINYATLTSTPIHKKETKMRNAHKKPKHTHAHR